MSDQTTSTKPKGNRKHAKGELKLSRCSKCGSTQRTAYHGIIRRNLTGFREGKPFNVMTWKRCQCKRCGQARVDVCYEMK